MTTNDPDRLAEAVAQLLWPKVSDKLDNLSQQLRFFRPLLQQIQTQLDDCRQELLALRGENTRQK